MYKSFKIENFRCFKNVTLDPLERLNLIAGKNNTGKTSFLEALFLQIGPNNPNLPLMVNAFRGIEAFSVEPEELWGPLFFDKNIEGHIELTSLNEMNERNTLKITLEEAEESFITPSRGGTTTTTIEPQMSFSPEAKELFLTYENGSGRKGISRAFINEKGEIKIFFGYLHDIRYHSDLSNYLEKTLSDGLVLHLPDEKRKKVNK